MAGKVPSAREAPYISVLLDGNESLLKSVDTNPQAYRDAMANFAAHVHLVTTEGEFGRRVIAATAVTSVSDDPPIILVCMNLLVQDNDIYLQNGIFAVSSLGEQHQAIAEACSGVARVSQEDRFALGEWEQLASGCPVLQDAVAVFDCNIIESREMSTHRVLFGKVNGVRGNPDTRPLIYHNRSYRIV